MSDESEAETLAMDYSSFALNSGSATSQAAADVQPEALAMPPPGPPFMDPVAGASPANEGAPPTNNLPALDLLHWSDTPTPNTIRPRISATNDSSAFMNASDESPMNQPPVRSEPAGGISTISFGSNLTLEESEQLQKRRPGSDLKRREMIGSRIFDQDVTPEPATDHAKKPSTPPGLMTIPLRPVNVASTEGSALSPKKPTSFSEIAKQKELCGTFLRSPADIPSGRRPTSSAKSKELEGSGIFGRSRQNQANELTPKSLEKDLNSCQENNAVLRTSVKVLNPAGGRSQIIFGCDGGPQLEAARCKKQGHDQKTAELSGHNIFKNEGITGMHNERASAAKRREMTGNNIFGQSPMNEERPKRGSRQPPGGESNLKLY
ncbi:hypothetical protein KP509_35G024200 [Ceratopteris richardii]|uniref:DUF4057 domain-containing protein n=1 Tax=Ceratopteris richardii TaxID=49495 RepID=A0A8T2QF88_CERRI|nr:hypothetical protein KP509_35G024200 [Ceratopteris richardii]